MPFTKSNDETASGRNRYIAVLQRLRDPFCVAAMVMGLIGFYANLLDIPLTFRGGNGTGQTTVLTLAAIVLLCIALTGIDRRGAFHRLSSACAGFAMLIALLPHTFEALGWRAIHGEGIDGKVGVDTSAVIVLIGIAVLCRYRQPTIGLATSFGAGTFILTGAIGQTYGLPYFDGDMALMTLCALAFVTFGTMVLYLDRPIVSVMFISSAIGLRTRLMMGVGFFVPWACGLLLYRGYGVPERGFHLEALLISVIICIMLAVTLGSGFLHEKADRLRRESEAKLAKMALHDPLTDLKNRAGIDSYISAAWDEHRLADVPAAVMLIDLDHFKIINDTFGHDTGDQVLMAVRDALLPHLRSGDVVGRWGGEEFLCLLNDADLRQLSMAAERLRLSLAAISNLPNLSHGKGRVVVTASIGVSAFIKGDRSYTDAIKRADEALYAAKRAGRNCVIFDPAMRPVVSQAAAPRENALTA